ncbi:hypothetical protein SCB49_07147 [unidentified eubacterium SCB49]|nr:hypothetical protein SCB49_07147 [unidentified eubacterium SCB49]
MLKQVVVSLFLILGVSSGISAQENTFLSRSFWKSNPSVAQLQELVKQGNDPAALTNNGFDGVVYAILSNVNDDAIKYLLAQEGNGVDKRTHDSRTYLFWAAYKGRVAVMQHLFDNGASFDVKDSKGNTPVTFTASAGEKSQEVYDLFEKQGVVLKDEVNKYGVNALLLIAPFLENEAELNYFLNKGFTLETLDPLRNNIFNYATKNGNIDFLNLLIKKGIDPKKVNTEGGNAMLYASLGTRNTQNKLETYQFLESLGVPVNVVGDNGKNPLHTIAAKNKNVAVSEYFIKNGVDVSLKDKEGNFPFGNASHSNTLEVVKTLFAQVKDVNLKDGEGRSALALAVASNDANVVKFLLDNGAAIDTKDNEGNTLAYFLFNERKDKLFSEKLELLKEYNLNFKEIQGGANTLAHIAVQKNNLSLLKQALAFGVDPNAVNDEGYTALHISAMKAKDDAILKYLVSKGANTSIKTDFDESVLDLASENELLQKNNVELNFLK